MFHAVGEDAAVGLKGRALRPATLELGSECPRRDGRELNARGRIPRCDARLKPELKANAAYDFKNRAAAPPTDVGADHPHAGRQESLSPAA